MSESSVPLNTVDSRPRLLIHSARIFAVNFVSIQQLFTNNWLQWLRLRLDSELFLWLPARSPQQRPASGLYRYVDAHLASGLMDKSALSLHGSVPEQPVAVIWVGDIA